jgi:hypothetical protein
MNSEFALRTIYCEQDVFGKENCVSCDSFRQQKKKRDGWWVNEKVIFRICLVHFGLHVRDSIRAMSSIQILLPNCLYWNQEEYKWIIVYMAQHFETFWTLWVGIFTENSSWPIYLHKPVILNKPFGTVFLFSNSLWSSGQSSIPGATRFSEK